MHAAPLLLKALRALTSNDLARPPRSATVEKDIWWHQSCGHKPLRSDGHLNTDGQGRDTEHGEDALARTGFITVTSSIFQSGKLGPTELGSALSEHL
mmetsp:Transcript_2154/g.6422  ORF Transcript_2154/g.6422 Transcript_2154/m.6422 type:complete len:97 (-) Transcript_2154:681-971(-)